MNSKLIRVVAVITVFCVMRLSVTAVPVVMGKLKTRDDKPISVNGSKVSSGTTILSGAQIHCPEKIGATIDIKSLGRIDIAPKTDLTLIFEPTRIVVELKSGYAILTTKPGVNGTIKTVEGKVFATDPSKLSSVIGKTAGAESPETAAQVGAGVAEVGSIADFLTATGMIVVPAAASKAGRGRNLSNSNPRQQD